MFVQIGLSQNALSSGSKEKNAILSSKQEAAEYLISLIQEEARELSEEDRKEMESRILHKLEAGKKLSAEEIDYLKKYNPILYQRYLRIRKMAEAMKEQLKHARSKEQARDIICRSIGSISDKDPDKQYIVAAMNEIQKEFTHSPAYARLPETEEAKKKASLRENRFGDEDAEEQDDLLSWSPLQEIIDMQPTFAKDA